MKVTRWFNGGSEGEHVAHVTQEMYKQNLELAEKNKILMLLEHIDEAVLSSMASAAKTPQIITDLLVKESDFSMAVIYSSDQEMAKANTTGISIQKKVSAEVEKFLLDRLGWIDLKAANAAGGPSIFFSDEIHISEDFIGFKPSLSGGDNTFLKDILGTKTIFICPMKASDRLLGVLVLGLSLSKEEISAYTHKLVKQLTSTVSITVENRLLYLELQEATDTLKRQNEKLKELDGVKDEFMSMATHQLGTPLTVIDGYLSTVLTDKKTSLDESHQHFLDQALRRTRSMKRLVADFLNVGRMEAGRFVIQATPTDLNQVVPDEIEQLSQKAQEKEVLLEYVRPSTPVPIIEIDDQKTRQAIMNLIDNAIFYTPKGKVSVQLSTEPDCLVFKVVDNGMGVPESQKAKLFSKFYRADNAKKERPDGTGIGLYLVKRVIEDQGGSIIFESQEGKGSTFGFRLPLRPKEATETTPQTKAI